jgi:hypothetical protein
MNYALTFPILFLLFGILCLWIMIGCKGWWAAKFWMINLVCILCLVLWYTVNSYLGWPSDSKTPVEFRLMGFVADEPKSLFILAETEDFSTNNIFQYKSQDHLRLYKTPYDKEFHKNLESAMEKVQKGAYVIVSKKKILDANELKQYNKVQDLLGGLEKLNEGGSNNNDAYNFYIMPPSKLMKKPD